MIKTLCILLAATTLFVACSSGDEQAHVNTPAVIDTSSPKNNVLPFSIDPYYTNPTEIVSVFGPAGIVRDLVIDNNGTIWLACWDGIVSYDGKVFTNHTLKFKLARYRMYSVMKDSKGNIWFGSMGAGAYKYDGRTFTALNSRHGMISNTVFDLFEDASGNIWFATDSGVSRYDGKSFLNISAADSLRDAIYAISQDTYGVMWIGGEAGLFQYDPADTANHAVEILTQQGTHYANVRDITNRFGTMYFGASSGLYVSKPLSHVPLQVNRINNQFTGYVNQDNSGNLLLTTEGISRFDGTNLVSIVSGLNNLGVFGAREAKDGSIWYGAMDGLHRVNGNETSSFSR